jgi:hypothetical protein
MSPNKISYSILGSALVVLAVSFSYVSSSEEYSRADNLKAQAVTKVEEAPKVIHLDTPEPLKAIYMTSCIASLPEQRKRLVKLIENTELNSIIIDVKDYTGIVSFTTNNPEIEKVSLSTKGCRVDDMTCKSLCKSCMKRISIPSPE